MQGLKSVLCGLILLANHTVVMAGNDVTQFSVNNTPINGSGFETGSASGDAIRDAGEGEFISLRAVIDVPKGLWSDLTYQDDLATALGVTGGAVVANQIFWNVGANSGALPTTVGADGFSVPLTGIGIALGEADATGIDLIIDYQITVSDQVEFQTMITSTAALMVDNLGPGNGNQGNGTSLYEGEVLIQTERASIAAVGFSPTLRCQPERIAVTLVVSGETNLSAYDLTFGLDLPDSYSYVTSQAPVFQGYFTTVAPTQPDAAEPVFELNFLPAGQTGTITLVLDVIDFDQTTWLTNSAWNTEQTRISSPGTPVYSKMSETVPENGDCLTHVDLNATGNKDGTSWADAFTTIQAGVDATDANGEVLIAEGTYMITDEIIIDKPLNIRGGFPAGGGVQDFGNHVTSVDAFEAIPADRQRVMRATHTTGVLFLEGLTIQNGYDANLGQGGAIHTTGDLSLSHVIIRDNQAIRTVGSNSAYGGGVYAQSGHIYLSDSQVISNSARSTLNGAGGGIHTQQGSVTLVNSVLDGNEVVTSETAQGGGIHTTGGQINIINSVVQHNRSVTASIAAEGGGLFTQSGAVEVVNSLLDDNRTIVGAPIMSTRAEGGGIWNGSGTINLINSAVTRGLSSSFGVSLGGGINGDFNLQNSLLWGNQSTTDGGSNNNPSEFNSTVWTTSHSLIKGEDLTADSGLDASNPGFDPLFRDEMNGDFSMQLGSSLIDAGDFNLLPADDFDVDGDADLAERIPLDLAGMTRELGANVEIGPYEFQIEYLVGGQLTGLLPGNSITIQNNGNDDLVLTADGAFVFGTPVIVGGAYVVSILVQPDDPIQPCTVTNAAGSITDQDITDVVVACEAGGDLIFRNGFE